VQTTTVVFMVVVLTLLWGGFAALLVHSMRTDGRRPGGDHD
jgi:ABC-type Fe3+ transport system permease subunit